ncbi:carbohydrate ABC transporter permease [Actinospica acidiphila]|uniref:Carbohydrate ABC transporter permease n=3 Tax=Streptomyces TaxID=1883 RepID=A0ABP7ZD84_9ACTN|nr:MULTISPECIES: carbohydrate ABC transporter permease [Streptomyces]MBJ6613766.1 carbohydrate ABC transporter permease [Streptomyces sp. I3(2020)]NEA79212.1 carbohydrate ABC transporter permease [Actinospica acidiphila]MBJ6628880.1 carbohydrate ABC transporter permease [Streptomyces sp. I4(2020)]MBQ0969595.1 carbohydrate ABC transporter permease [Streptomyces sp. RK31]MBU5948191.1 carbohydrate ABC transporter permease [Streptomyces sp. PAM3C]
MVSRLGFLGAIARLFMWAFLLSLAVVVLYPLLWMVLNGFKTNAELFGNPFALPTDLSFGNYRDAWNRGVSDYLAASVLVTVTSTVATVFISAWAAYGLTRVDIPFNKVLTAVILGGLMLTPTVALVPLVRMFQSMGLYNSFWALLILYTAFRVPFTTFLIRAYMIDLPREVDEAAQIDGAGRWTAFWRIILPMCKPIITSTVLLHVLFAWNEYLFAMVFTNGSDVQTLPVGLTSLMSKHGTDFPVVFAGMVIAAVPVVLLFLFGQRYIVKGLADGIGK